MSKNAKCNARESSDRKQYAFSVRRVLQHVVTQLVHISLHRRSEMGVFTLNN